MAKTAQLSRDSLIRKMKKTSSFKREVLKGSQSAAGRKALWVKSSHSFLKWLESYNGTEDYARAAILLRIGFDQSEVPVILLTLQPGVVVNDLQRAAKSQTDYFFALTVAVYDELYRLKHPPLIPKPYGLIGALYMNSNFKEDYQRIVWGKK